jgi:hypothetical protein
MEGKQKLIPSIVWFELLDSHSIDGRKPIYFFDSPIHGVDEILRRLPDGKINVSWRSMAVSLGKRNRKQVEATAKTVNNQTDLNVDDGAYRLNIAELNNLLAHLRVWFGNETVRGVIAPGIDPLLQTYELGCGPIQTSFRI